MSRHLHLVLGLQMAAGGGRSDIVRQRDKKKRTTGTITHRRDASAKSTSDETPSCANANTGGK